MLIPFLTLGGGGGPPAPDPTVHPLTLFPAIHGQLPGLTTGTLGVPPPGLGAFLGPVLGASTISTPAPESLGDEPGPTVVGDVIPMPILSGTFDWFDRIHVLPRGPLGLGRVVETTEEPFEVFSAFSVPVVFTGATIPGGLKVSIPNLPGSGTILPAFSSLADPASTPGAIVLLNVRADPSGPPSLAGTILFHFVQGGAAALQLSGVRFEVLLDEYESPLEETLEWATRVLAAALGPEQRISHRESPRQRFRPKFVVSGEARRRMQNLLFGALGRAFGFPVWLDRVLLTAASSPGATSLSVSSTASIDLRVGGFALLIHDTGTFDVVEIASVAANTVGLDDELAPANGYAIGDRLVPLRVVVLEPSIGSTRFPVTLEMLEAECVSIENVTGAPTGDLTPYATVYGHPFVDDANVLYGDRLGGAIRQKVVRIDNDSGAIYQDQEWSTSRSHGAIGLVARTRAQAWKHRRLFYGLRGRQVSFWRATGIEDLEVVATLTSGASTMDVAFCGYTAHVQARGNKAVFRITFTDGTTLLRQVLSSVEQGPTVERLTLDATWPSTKTAGQVQRVEFLELVRLAADAVELSHDDVGRQAATAPTMTVLDET